MEQIGREIVSKELNSSPAELLLWKVYTDKDINLKTSHIQRKALKRPSKTSAQKRKFGNSYIKSIILFIFENLKNIENHKREVIFWSMRSTVRSKYMEHGNKCILLNIYNYLKCNYVSVSL